ncbi:mucin-5AC-like isoform X1 [Cheilinus undulatus]|uniref:mucin-5AC-like isoform X1 n=1 Tax=Cheilinus undulatus TaxID=241271 RepID=UPI001BD31936|nr:mucin-5AC-like isoform X1 [Cheilinus undulatus]
MKFQNNLVFCVLIILTGPSQTRGQSSVAVSLETSTSPGSTENPDHEVPLSTHSPTGQEETSAATTITGAAVHPETVQSAAFQTSTTSSPMGSSQHSDVPFLISTQALTTPSSSSDLRHPVPDATKQPQNITKPPPCFTVAPVNSLSSTPTVESSTPPQHISTTESRTLLTTEPHTTFSSLPAHTVQGSSSTAHASTIQQQSESLTTASTQQPTTGLPLTSATGQGAAGPTHKEVPSELNVGGEDHKRPHSTSPLDPLLAGLLSVFIVTTAIVFVILFLKFRQRTNHPEFHRLQDLPMDDLMEDTPLSRYSY